MSTALFRNARRLLHGDGGRLCRSRLLPDAAQVSGRGAGIRPSLESTKSGSFGFSTRVFASCSAAPAASRNGVVGWYLASIESRPVLTKAVTACVIFTAADLCSQMITLEEDDTIDAVRTMRMAGYGLLFSGPSSHLWFNSASRIFPKQDILNTFKKMLLGQTVYGPIMTTIFLSQNAALQGETPAEILARLKRDLVPTLKSGLIYWPTCDFLTFKFFPVRLQPLVSNSFSFLWTIYLTYMASLKKVGLPDKPAD